MYTERDCFNYILVQTYDDVGLHSRRHPIDTHVHVSWIVLLLSWIVLLLSVLVILWFITLGHVHQCAYMYSIH